MKYILVFSHDGVMWDDRDAGGETAEIFDSLEKAIDFIATEDIPHMKKYFLFDPLYLFKSNSNHLEDTFIKERIKTRKEQIIQERQEEDRKRSEQSQLLKAKNEYEMYLALKEKYENMGEE